MLNSPPHLRIANAHAVLNGPHGSIAQHALQHGLSRQVLYRDTQRLLHTLQTLQPPDLLPTLHAPLDSLHAPLRPLQALPERSFCIDDDRRAAFASTAQAEGVSLPVARRLLQPLLARPLTPAAARTSSLPSVARLGRWSRAAARRAAALRPVLDQLGRPRVEPAAADEIFFGKQPCLMVIEQHSLCWVSGRLAPRRDGPEWAREFRALTHLRQTTQDAGQGLAKGLAIVNQERQQAGQAAIVCQDDPFHVLRQGSRVLGRMQGQLSRYLERADQADRQAARQQRRTGGGGGKAAAARAWRRAERAYDSWVAAQKAWQEVGTALRLFRHEGALNTRAEAQAALEVALSSLSGPHWAQVRRQLQRPQLLTFLDQAQERVSSLPVSRELVAAAVRVEGLRRQPEAVRGKEASAGVLRGLLLAAGLVLTLSGAAGAQAAAGVRRALRGVWRASSLVECINSVARMQQSRHQKMTQGLLDLKRLYWNCRELSTGPRRKKSPYELQGVRLPTPDWWELLRRTPEQLRDQLQIANAPPAELPEKVSGQEDAA